MHTASDVFVILKAVRPANPHPGADLGRSGVLALALLAASRATGPGTHAGGHRSWLASSPGPPALSCARIATVL